ncbi:MAG: hypothetical protein RJA13_2221 [Bacteroidota bacterium]
MKHFVFFLVIGFSFYSFSQAVLTPELLWKLNRVSGGTVSPDGNFLLYSQRSFDMAANKGNTDLFVIDLKNNQSKQITATPFSEMEAQWGKNNTIWFVSAEKNGLQIWKMKYDGSEKIQCSNFTDIEFEGFKLSPDESMVLTIEALKLKPTITDKYADLPKANARIEDDLMYRHWDHFDDYKRRHLILHRINTERIFYKVKCTMVLFLHLAVRISFVSPMIQKKCFIPPKNWWEKNLPKAQILQCTNIPSLPKKR